MTMTTFQLAFIRTKVNGYVTKDKFILLTECVITLTHSLFYEEQASMFSLAI